MRLTWFMNPYRCVHVRSKFSGRLVFGSKGYVVTNVLARSTWMDARCALLFSSCNCSRVDIIWLRLLLELGMVIGIVYGNDRE